MLYPLRDLTGVSLSLSPPPSLAIYICLLLLYPSVYLFDLFFLYSPRICKLNLFFYSPSIYKFIDVSKLISLSIHTSRLDAIRFQDDLKAACSFWAYHASKGTRRSWSNVNTICPLCLPGYPQ
jgi:hypothetical protein